MTRIIPLAIVAVLIVAGVVLSLTVGSDHGRQVQGSEGKRFPNVWEALETADGVNVYVALRPLEDELTQPDAALEAHASEIQERVLGVLTSEDFSLRARFRFAAAVSGLITKSGLVKLEGHPDVIGIELVVPGTLPERPQT